MIIAGKQAEAETAPSQKQLLEELEESERLCEELHQTLQKTLHSFQCVLNDGEDMDLLLEDISEDIENPLQLLSHFSREFMTKLKRTRAICIKVAESLPQDDLNLAPSTHFSSFMDSTTQYLLAGEAEIVLHQLEDQGSRQFR